MGERAAISTWFWRGALTETARLSRPKSFRLSLKRAWWSPSTNSVSTSTSMSSAAMAWMTAGGIDFLPVRWFRFQAARWRVSCDMNVRSVRWGGGTKVRPGLGVGTARKWWEGAEMRAACSPAAGAVTASGLATKRVRSPTRVGGSREASRQRTRLDRVRPNTDGRTKCQQSGHSTELLRFAKKSR